jgi:hypothetical protein
MLLRSRFFREAPGQHEFGLEHRTGRLDPAVERGGQLHTELAGKLLANQCEAKRPRTSMLQVEAVMKMLDHAVNLRLIAPKRRNTGNPWFKRGTLFRSAVDVLRRASAQ